jgi:hypothetical protein
VITRDALIRAASLTLSLTLSLLSAWGIVPLVPTAESGPRSERRGDEPARSLGDVTRAVYGRSAARGASRAGTADTITVYHADLEGLGSPGNEGGFVHQDKSGVPTAWNIGGSVACQGNAFWCGLIDSTWTGDPNRRGYANAWTQTLSNFADLSGVNGPYKLSFKHTLNIEADYDFALVEVLDPDEAWVTLFAFTGVVSGPSGALCDTFTVTIPDSIIAKSPTLQFRFVFQSDLQGSSADGLYPQGEGWSIDNVTVKAGVNDIRFFDDFESGPGTWTVSTFPPVGDFWHINASPPTQELCTTNTSKVWDPTNPLSGALVPRMDDHLIAPPVFVSGADQVFFTFDVYRNLPFLSCFYYEVAFRSRSTGDPAWSAWLNPTGLLYFGNEQEWLRQNVPLAGAAGADSVQVRVAVKDYADVFCDGVSSASGTALYLDNLDIRVLGSAGPTIATTEASRFNDTFQTAPFFGDDNFNTPRGDSAVVRIGASRGLKTAFFHYSIGVAPFAASPLTPVGAAAPDVYYGDVPAAGYPRGTELRYYFSATDSMNATVTLPADAVSASHYFRATVLPGIHAATPACPDDTARVLYVNAFSEPDEATGMDQSLGALGVRYDRFDVNAAASNFGNTPGGGDPSTPGRFWPGTPVSALGPYAAILWDVGERTSLTLSPQDQTLLQSWLALAGRNRGLILAGDNVAHDLTVNGQGIAEFLSCAIGATFQRDVWENAPQDSLLPTLIGATGTRIASEPFGLDGDCPGVNRFDAFTVSSCAGANGRAWLRWPNGLIAATERRGALASPGDSVRSVLLGFSLAAMPSAVRRNLFLWRTLVEEMEVSPCTTPTGVETAAARGMPPARLHPLVPNPFNPSTTVRFTLASAARVRLTVFDVAGARVRVLANGAFPAGEHRILWDGRNDRGTDVGSAAYFVRLEAAGRSNARKVVLLR